MLYTGPSLKFVSYMFIYKLSFVISKRFILNFCISALREYAFKDVTMLSNMKCFLGLLLLVTLLPSFEHTSEN